MSTQLQLRRDTTANVAAITPAQGEPLYDVTRKALVLGDGATAGGLVATPFSGTWTPQLEFGGASVGMTGTFTGFWIEVGQLVVAFFTVTLTAKGSSTGAATIAGLPVAALAGYEAPAIIGSHAAMATADVFESYASGTAIALGKGDDTGWAALADTDFTNTSSLSGMVIYPAATAPTA